MIAYLHICVYGHACSKQSNGYSEWESIPSNYFHPLSVTLTMCYISTHHYDRSADLVLLSWCNMLVDTTIMLLFLIALLADFVGRLWKIVWSLCCPQGVAFGQLPGILSLTSFHRPAMRTALAAQCNIKHPTAQLHIPSCEPHRLVPRCGPTLLLPYLSAIQFLFCIDTRLLSACLIAVVLPCREPIEKSEESKEEEETTNKDANLLGCQRRKC